MPHEVTKYAAYEQSEAARLSARDARRTVARQKAVAEITRTLSKHPNIRKLILFGSVAHGNPGYTSDIDLAVDGIAASDYITIWLKAEEIAGDIPFDLVVLSEASDELREIILAEGVILFDREQLKSNRATAVDHDDQK